MTNPSVPLKEYVDKVLQDLQDQVDRRFVAEAKATDKAAEALATRLESMNEFRLQLTSERSQYVQKEQMNRELEILKGQIKADIDTAMKQISNLEKNENFVRGRNLGLIGVGFAAIIDITINIIKILRP